MALVGDDGSCVLTRVILSSGRRGRSVLVRALMKLTTLKSQSLMKAVPLFRTKAAPRMARLRANTTILRSSLPSSCSMLQHTGSKANTPPGHRVAYLPSVEDESSMVSWSKYAVCIAENRATAPAFAVLYE